MSMTPLNVTYVDPLFIFNHNLTSSFLQPHSEVPQKDEDWPIQSDILEYQTRVRERLLQIYDDIEKGKRTLTRRLARVLFMTLEHEGLHAEVCIVNILPVQYIG